MKKQNLFSVFILLLLILETGCKNNRDFSCLEKIGLNSIAWKTDSFACKCYRDSSYTKIALCKDLIVNKKDSDFIKDFFGEPDFRNRNPGEVIFLYVVEPSIFCRDTLLDRSLRWEFTTCYFVCGEKGVVTRMGTAMP